MTQKEFIELHVDSLRHKIRKWDRCGLRFWELFTDAEKRVAVSHRGCFSCVFREEDYCHNAGKKISEIDVL